MTRDGRRLEGFGSAKPEELGGFYRAEGNRASSCGLCDRKEQAMKGHTIALAAIFALWGTSSYAQGTGSTTGDPAASSQNAKPDTTGMAPNKSGSGTSTSGGRDDNGDQGRDKMPESSMKVHPVPGKPDIPNPGPK
jgi:hypothetical protein